MEEFWRTAGPRATRPVTAPGYSSHHVRVIFEFDEFELDIERFELRRGGVPCHVEPQVFDVLRYLVEHRDRVVSKDELLDNVWGDRFVSESALTSRVKAARRAVGDSGRTQRVIGTAHGRGYRFLAGRRSAQHDARCRRGFATRYPVHAEW